MTTLKRLKRQKCDCGRAVAEGSVFCISCRAEVKRQNRKTLCHEKEMFIRKFS